MQASKVLSFLAGLLAMVMSASSMRGQVSFPGPELLGRPTDHSVTINVVASAAIEAYFEYGTQSGLYTKRALLMEPQARFLQRPMYPLWLS